MDFRFWFICREARADGCVSIALIWCQRWRWMMIGVPTEMVSTQNAPWTTQEQRLSFVSCSDTNAQHNAMSLHLPTIAPDSTHLLFFPFSSTNKNALRLLFLLLFLVIRPSWVVVNSLPLYAPEMCWCVNVNLYRLCMRPAGRTGGRTDACVRPKVVSCWKPKRSKEREQTSNSKQQKKRKK